MATIPLLFLAVCLVAAAAWLWTLVFAVALMWGDVALPGTACLADKVTLIHYFGLFDKSGRRHCGLNPAAVLAAETDFPGTLLSPGNARSPHKRF